MTPFAAGAGAAERVHGEGPTREPARRRRDAQDARGLRRLGGKIDVRKNLHGYRTDHLPDRTKRGIRPNLNQGEGRRPCRKGARCGENLEKSGNSSGSRFPRSGSRVTFKDDSTIGLRKINHDLLISAPVSRASVQLGSARERRCRTVIPIAATMPPPMPEPSFTRAAPLRAADPPLMPTTRWVMPGARCASDRSLSGPSSARW